MIVGIDFGTESSCVCVYEPVARSLRVIANDLDQPATPSYVSYTEAGCLVGEAARARSESHPADTVYHMKRFLGRKFADPSVQTDISTLPFRVEADEQGYCCVHIPSRGRRVKVVEIVAIILSELRRIAEKRLGCSVTAAVVTVPVCFTSVQRQAIIDACTVAGLEVLRLLNETTAAALWYGASRDLRVSENVMVFDLGAGHFQLSMITLKDGDITVQACTGEQASAGLDWERVLSGALTEGSSVESLNFLNLEARNRWRMLSSREIVILNCLQIAQLTPAEGERSEHSAFLQSYSQGLSQVIRDSAVSDFQYLFSGGFTRSRLLRDYLVSLNATPDKRTGNKIISAPAEQSVAQGAAILAHALSNDAIFKEQKICLTEQTQHACVVATSTSPERIELYPRNQSLPLSRTLRLPTTTLDYLSDRAELIQCGPGFESVSGRVSFFGRLVEVAVTVDENGLLDGNVQSEFVSLTTSEAHASGLSTEDITAMQDDLRYLRREHEDEETRQEAKATLLALINQASALLPAVSDQSRYDLQRLLVDVNEWLLKEGSAEASVFKQQADQLREALPVTTAAISIGLARDERVEVIREGSPLPVVGRASFTSASSDQRFMPICLFDGEAKLLKVLLVDLPLGLAREVEVDVTVHMTEKASITCTCLPRSRAKVGEARSECMDLQSCRAREKINEAFYREAVEQLAREQQEEAMRASVISETRKMVGDKLQGHYRALERAVFLGNGYYDASSLLSLTNAATDFSRLVTAEPRPALPVVCYESEELRLISGEKILPHTLHLTRQGDKHLTLLKRGVALPTSVELQLTPLLGDIEHLSITEGERPDGKPNMLLYNLCDFEIAASWLKLEVDENDQLFIQAYDGNGKKSEIVQVAKHQRLNEQRSLKEKFGITLYNHLQDVIDSYGDAMTAEGRSLQWNHLNAYAKYYGTSEQSRQLEVRRAISPRLTETGVSDNLSDDNYSVQAETEAA